MCPGRIPAVWPLTREPVKALRLFKPESWQDQAAWQHLRAFLRTTDSQVLVGTPVSCDDTYDVKTWQQTAKLLAFLGRDRVMGLSVGNEIELNPTKECPDRLLHHFEEHWRRCALDLSVLGGGEFANLPMTSVMTTSILYSEDKSWSPQSMRIMDGSVPWPPETPWKLDFQSVFRRLVQTISAERFIFTFNIYPYFLPCPPAVSISCDQWMRDSLCFDDPARCITPKTAAGARYALQSFAQQLAGDAVSPLRMWIGEVGWSSPKANSLSDGQCRDWGTKECSGWSNLENLAHYYKDFMNWDLNLGTGLEPPEYAFYFTIRDSFNFHHPEHFGLCGS
eukprot:CAMPEP_0172898574 /NCGR_PEP_ID=MMETSP1075-20121228/159976_1 /TAXON_ID=2916 /ORGANISM="Ceratium fusus, Strain PA161109" /LENGTH=335 /DNA_ID=CAMNT_0013754393 /DNA_START=44 /DNA_END=1047 /DNA_ORIENTATION=+